VIKSIQRAIELAKRTIKDQEKARPELVGWYVCAHTRHTIDISVGVDTGPMSAFSVLVRVDLMTGAVSLI